MRPSLSRKFPVLISYAFARNNLEFFQWYVRNPGVEVLLDSGAFTALNAGVPVALDDYMRFVHDWEAHLFGYMALDVLGDPARTGVNYAIMRENGLAPIPVHVRGDAGPRMDYLFTMSNWVALGGLRRPHRGACSPSYVKQKMSWAAGRNVHWLGYTRAPMIRAFRPYSCDCSSWSAGGRWGSFDMYLGNWEWSARANLAAGGAEAPFSQRELVLLRECGLTPRDVRDPRRWRCTPTGVAVAATVTAYSWVKYVRDVRRLVGTRLFLAAIPVTYIDALLRKFITSTAQ